MRFFPRNVFEVDEQCTVVEAEPLEDGVEVASARIGGGCTVAVDLCVPGFVDTHCTALKRRAYPRRAVRLPEQVAAALYFTEHATGCVCCACEAIAVSGTEVGRDPGVAQVLADCVQSMAASGVGPPFPFLHLRVDVTSETSVLAAEKIIGGAESALRVVSLMNHAPVTGRYPSERAFVEKHLLPRGVVRRVDQQNEIQRRAQAQPFVRPRMEHISALAHLDGVAVGIHDPNASDISCAVEMGASLAEFPVSVPAAIQARDSGMHVAVGMPNILLGGSHSGGVSALDLLRAGVADILSSDYLPFSHLEVLRALIGSGVSLGRALDAVIGAPLRLLGAEDLIQRVRDSRVFLDACEDGRLSVVAIAQGGRLVAFRGSDD